MKKFTASIFLLAIFLFALFLRLFFAFQSPEFSYDSYFVLRQVEHIKETGRPIFSDSLSFGGRVFIFPPLFYYILSLFSFVFSVEYVVKILPNVFYSLSIFAVYLLSFHITKKRVISLLAAFSSAFIPIYFLNLNNVSVYSLVLPLFLFIIYCVLKSEDKNYLNLSLFLLILLVLTHSSSFFLIFGFLLFLFFLKVEGLVIEDREIEIILFSTFLIFWFNFVLFKQALFVHGPFVIWQNIPLQILKNFFSEFNILEVIYYLGFIPLIFGFYAVFHVFSQIKKKSVFMIVGFVTSSLILLWLKLIRFRLGLIFLGVMLVLLAAYSWKLFYSYLRKTKVPKNANVFLIIVFILFIISSFIPAISLANNSSKLVPSDEEINALLWIEENTPKDAVILSRPEEGHLITYFAKRKNVLDSNYLLITDANQRFMDVNMIYKVRFKIEVVRKLNKYDVDYIYFSSKFGPETKLFYADSSDCFTLVYNSSIKVYEVHCEI
ncbi:MAG: glycosyltransferase family 39 protein [Nanoarchaeota archaeon]|nr:glycosyltransferase family 39 protein [Nanoarchaeota archaeon]MBU1029995.1 glycosyltransferase family 39 protein [Nanoarchaeota archaeon]MBU1849368.1 glycosyltransferase family 39 protein [Nanoarchaeota archaeon]